MLYHRHKEPFVKIILSLLLSLIVFSVAGIINTTIFHYFWDLLTLNSLTAVEPIVNSS